ncbi:hypothetical protein EVAR_100609_1 [Eumeta japonica]|uniref:Uncharacterized protein n=1 Tax=Eumeta variegata TaxID=151549 RepID=A0A4C1ZAV3_EUMVA|nr:hypothetical protein EVAR_100609_1 [Eumeta japonica]
MLSAKTLPGVRKNILDTPFLKLSIVKDEQSIGLGTYIFAVLQIRRRHEHEELQREKAHGPSDDDSKLMVARQKPLSAARQREQSEINLSVLAFSAKISPLLTPLPVDCLINNTFRRDYATTLRSEEPPLVFEI